MKVNMSAGYAWIFGIVSLFAIGLLYMIFLQVYQAHFIPVIENQLNTTYATGTMTHDSYTSVLDGINGYMTAFKIVPFVLFLCIVVFMIVAAWRKDTESEQF